ncbi:MAG: hypothetical protein IJQ12_07870 [Lachnospiraceae bacterium]|nr:hypothetical protein [Lachnospiraceae bacterium]
MKENTSLLGRLSHNWGWKLASVLLAALLWFLVTNYNDPVISVPFYNIPVTLRNTSVLTDAGQVYEILDNTDTVATVTVTANRSIAESLSRDNIIATADLSELTSRDTVPIHLSVNKNASDITRITGSIEDVRLNIEDRKTRTIALTVTTSGELTDGYVIGQISPAQNLVRISGPASRVDNVASAVADVDVTGFTSEIGTEADIRLYDAQDVLIRDTAITQNITSVRVQVAILTVRTVPLRARYTGTPETGYMVAGDALIQPETVTIAGTAAQIQDVTEIVLEGETLDISGRTQELVTSVRIAPFLPAGVTLAHDPQDLSAEVTIPVQIEFTTERHVPYTRIILENIPEGASYEIVTGEETAFTVTVVGLEETVEALNVEEMVFAVDVGAAIGADAAAPPEQIETFAVLRQPDGLRIVGTVPVTLRLQ